MFKNFRHQSLLKTIFFLVALTSSSIVFANDLELDSAKNTHKLQAVTVSGQRLTNTRVALPVQVITASDIVKLNATNVADVAKNFTGITIKDYGGIGGLKTISVRSLGAQHTAVAYDGITLNDTQTGQIDLGRFSLDNVESISLSNGQPDDLFQPARMYASGAVLSIITKTPRFNENRTFQGQASVKVGSFGFINPSFSINKKISKLLTLNLNSEYLSSEGNYPYTMYYGGANDSTARKRRSSSDVRSFKNELNAYFLLQEKEKLNLKLYYLDGERGLPGATIQYREDNKARLWDKNFFTQVHYENKNNEKINTQFSGKYSYFANTYQNISINLPNGIQTDDYWQKELYGTGSILFKPTKELTVSSAIDASWNSMYTNIARFPLPERLTILSVVAAKYSRSQFELSASLLHTYTHEWVKTGISSADRSRFSPTLAVMWQPFPEKNIGLRAFYKDVFRVPTFNDLYYVRMGNPLLRPEKIKQFNIGMIVNNKLFSFLKNASFSTDVYYNNVTDKIIAKVKENLFVSTMINMDKVLIYGAYVNFKCSAMLSSNTELKFNAGYTFQRAFDATPRSKTYGNQIVYTPFHSGTSSVSVCTNWLELGYSGCFSGERWHEIETSIKSNRMDAYADHSLFALKNFEFKSCRLLVKAELLNILNTQYSIVNNFPMPGRCFRVSISTQF